METSHTALTDEREARKTWHAKLGGRIVDAETGIEINASEEVRNLLTSQLVLTMAALNFGSITRETPQYIWDSRGKKHTMSAAQLVGLLLRYGTQWQGMFAKFAP